MTAFNAVIGPSLASIAKKRELVGNFCNSGRRWDRTPRHVWDHDFRTDSIGVAIPYGIYDVTENRGTLRDRGFPRNFRLRRSCLRPGGGKSKEASATRNPVTSSSWPIPAAAMGHSVAPGSKNCSGNCAKGLGIEHHRFPLPPAPPNGIPSNIACSRRCRGTGRVNPSTTYQKILNYARTTRTKAGLLRHRLPGSSLLALAASSLRQNSSLPCGFQRHEILPDWNYTIRPQS